MKKHKKIINTLLSVTSLAAVTTPLICLTSCNGSNEADKEAWEYMNNHTFSLGAWTADSGGRGTAWILSPVEDATNNQYDYYMVTNAHVWDTDPSVEKEVIQFNWYNTLEENRIVTKDLQYSVTMENTSNDFELVYSNFEGQDKIKNTQGVDTNIKVDASVIKVDFNDYVGSNDFLKQKLDLVNNDFTLNKYNKKSIPLADTILLDSASESDWSNPNFQKVFPDKDNNGKHEVYLMGYPVLRDSGGGIVGPEMRYNKASLDGNLGVFLREDTSSKNTETLGSHFIYGDDTSDIDNGYTFQNEFILSTNEGGFYCGGSSGSMVVNENKELVGIYCGMYWIGKDYNKYFASFAGTALDGTSYDFLRSFYNMI